DGMTCSGCARHVTEALEGVNGVDSAQVSLADQRAAVRWRPAAEANITALLEAVRRAGFKAEPLADAAASEHAHGGAPEGIWNRSMLFALASMLGFMAGEWPFRLGTSAWFRWASFALAACVQFGPGMNFYRGAWNQLKVRRANMDTLVALGSTTAFLYSVG